VTVALAALAALATVAACWLAWARVRDAIVTEFEQRIAGIASTAAAQVSPAAIDEARSRGEEGGGYLALQVQLVTLRTATGVADASLVDTTRATLVDARAPDETERFTTPLDSLARGALDAALAGRAAVSPDYTYGGATLRAAIAPVLRDRRVAGAVAVEAQPAYREPLAALARRLALIALLSLAAIAVFTVLLVRITVASTRLERRLSRAENLAAMGRLTATLAHEIKNPLAIIRGSAERLNRGDAEQQRMATFVIEEADRLSHTVARYLAFARGDEAPREHGDALAALASTLALLEVELAGRHVVLERVRGPVDSATVALDPESLKQVYLNLLLNAIEAMPDGGRVRVTDRVAGGALEVEIADDGAGIPPELLRRIGEPFVTSKAQGSGLGLFLARRLAQAAGGDLAIRSAPGRGTTCTLRLPRVEPGRSGG